MEANSSKAEHFIPWNKGRLVGQKLPLRAPNKTFQHTPADDIAGKGKESLLDVGSPLKTDAQSAKTVKPAQLTWALTRTA